MVAAFAGLSLGATLAKKSGSPGAVVALWRFAVAAVLWLAIRAVRRPASGTRVPPASGVAGAFLPGVLFGVNLSCSSPG